MKSHKFCTLCLIFSLLFFAISCRKNILKQTNTISEKKIVPENLKWSERMMLSEIARFPNPSLLDFREKPQWTYTPGVVLSACIKVFEKTKNPIYYNYLYDYPNQLI
ncbi:glycoside hydrolase family 88 protein, partial [Polaribacter sp. BAL334]|uniref:glycoside hydrolase family 88 protein n=1 Tax=Polaribacter sp. BAL334 TaxID=1708178 RepID=UPI0018D25347